MLLRPDSEYAHGAIIGDFLPGDNQTLIRNVKRMYKQLLVQKKNCVFWHHVAAHAGHKWNELVDEFAKRGAARTHGDCVPGKTWAKVRIDGGLDFCKRKKVWPATLHITINKIDEKTFSFNQHVVTEEDSTWTTAPW